jgi:hypoxanthine phosphoribosyltransferase
MPTEELADATHPVAPEREVLTWQLFGTALRELAQTVADDGFVPDLVLGIARGGLSQSRIAVPYDKPRSVVRPHYCWRSTDRWITFPWSAQPPVTGRSVVAEARA